MKRSSPICLFLTAALAFSQSTQVPLSNSNASVASPVSPSQPGPKGQARILDQYGKLPLSFEANHGETDSRVKFLSRTSGYLTAVYGGDSNFLSSMSKGVKQVVNKAGE